MTDIGMRLRTLADQAEADDLPPEDLIGALEAMKARVWAGLVTAPPSAQAPSEPEGLLDVTEAAVLLGRSPSWVEKKGRSLPGRVQPTGKGGKVRWSRAALVAWRDGLASQTP